MALERVPETNFVAARTLYQKDGLRFSAQKIREAATDAMPISGIATKAWGGWPVVFIVCSRLSVAGFPSR